MRPFCRPSTPSVRSCELIHQLLSFRQPARSLIPGRISPLDTQPPTAAPMLVSGAIAVLVRGCRAEMDLTQEELAERAGPYWRTADIAALESGRILMPHWSRLSAFASALSVPVEQLIQLAHRAGAAEMDEADSQLAS